jgi:hypothetical protein
MHALSAALGLLTIQKTWARDDTRTGAKIVAKTWENALYIAPWSVSETCKVIPIPPMTDTDDADDMAAAVILQFLIPIIHAFNMLAPTLAGCSDAVEAVMADLADYGADGAVEGMLKRLCADLNSLPSSTRLNYELACPQVDQWDDLRNKIHSNPYDWLNQLSSWLFGWLNSTGDQIVQDLNTVGGLIGGANILDLINHNGGVTPGGGAGFGDDCQWEHMFDFTTGDHGWSLAVGLGCTQGIRTSLGVESFPGRGTYCPDTPAFESGYYWQHPTGLGDINVTYFDAYYTWETGDTTSGEIVAYFGPFGEDRPPAEGDNHFVWTGAAVINAFFVSSRCSYHVPGGDLDPVGHARLQSITMRGPGTTDPYAGL